MTAAGGAEQAIASLGVNPVVAAPAPSPHDPPVGPRPYRVALMAWESIYSAAVGTVGAVVDPLAAALVTRGHEVHVYVRAPRGSTLPGHKLIDGAHYHFVGFEPVETDLASECLNMCNLMVHFMLETEQFMNEKFDIIHFFDWLTAQALINIKMNHNRFCVFTMHSTEPGRKFGRNFGKLADKMQCIERDAVQLADRIIGTTGPLCDEIIASFEFDKSNVRCVPLSVDCLAFDTVSQTSDQVKRNSLDVPLSTRIVLFPAALDNAQGVDMVIDSIPQVVSSMKGKQVCFVLAGGTPTLAIKKRVDELDVRGSLHFTGPLKRRSLVDLYHAADVILAPSTKSGFSFQVLIAWACKKPVLVSNSGGMRDLVWHENDGLTVKAEGSGVAWGITRILGDAESAAFIGEQGRVKAAFSYSHQRVGSLTNDIYDELHGIFPPPPPSAQ